MGKNIKIIVNHKECLAKTGQTILAVAKQGGIDIPSLCFHPDLEARASCRLCLVDIKDKKDLQPACSTKVEEGMIVRTESPRLSQTRKTNLELIFGEHHKQCPGCVLEKDCRLLELGKKYHARVSRFANRKTKKDIVQCGPLIFDQTKCIDCRNCVEVCPTGFLEVKNRGTDMIIAPSADKNKDCAHCGQCIIHCPVGAISSAGENQDVAKPLKLKKNKVLVAQFAPAVRSSLGEAFGLPPGQVTTGQLTAGLKKLGFAYVFDTCVGADFTSVEEARELIDRIAKNKGLPIFSSCCPAWVKFVETRYPRFLPNLCTTRSPQIILGGLIKTYWARQQNLDSKNIIVVSIMPCISKKYEIKRPELKIKSFTKWLDGRLAFWTKARPPVDFVLTTRELAYLFKKRHIDLKTIKPVKADNPFGNPSGAGVIYGASGGVFESALRTAIFQTSGKNSGNLNFKALRGQAGIKKAKIKLGEITIKAVVVNGLVNAKTMLEELKKNPQAFDAMEVMACPGGCVGGGGQPMPADDATRQKRAQALYNLDAKKELRLAHENPAVKKVYKEFSTNKTIIHQLFHTRYSRKRKSKLVKLKNVKTL
ncbi:MAG: [FeFe] hydrogenase, group A [bacterium]|nr:[FeFe] hydrogenase, group A [bacterium]